MNVECIFTHVVVTAPAESIADVYRDQLHSLRETLPYLRNAVVACVADPCGYRVGSGGGTLNALNFLRSQIGLGSFSKCRILIIHSGGESRRAPLYSLVGKAWTTINSALEGGDIACPLALLIKEISLFSVNLSVGSIVVASSDVMLDIAGPHCTAMSFPNDSVLVVTVPESPATAKNHGVLVIPDVSDANEECVIAPAVSYMQKPSLEQLNATGAVYSAAAGSVDEAFALVDTGVVIFTGAATHALEAALDHSALANCTERGLKRAVGATPLRLELYTDFLLTLALNEQTVFDLSVYHRRLGIQAASLTSEEEHQYLRALEVLWAEFSRIPLGVVYVPTGMFEHLGTTAEVLELLVATEHSNAASEGSSNGGSVARKDRKLTRFAAKYQLQRSLQSRVNPLELSTPAVIVNSLLHGDLQHTWHAAGSCVVEHSVLSGNCSLPRTAFVSHLCATLGRNLQVSDGIMLQQVYLRRETAAGTNGATPAGGVPFALLVLGIADDVKKAVTDPGFRLCGATWTQCQAVGLTEETLWEAGMPAPDRTLWTAKLFCGCQQDGEGHLWLVRNDGKCVEATPLALTWMQDLTAVTSKKHSDAINGWTGSRRLSLADILTLGDAQRMFHWRQWLQCAYQAGCGDSGRVLRTLGSEEVHRQVDCAFRTMTCIMDYLTPSLVLALWMARLCLHGADEDTVSSCLLTVATAFDAGQDRREEKAEEVVGHFQRLWHCVVERRSDPSIPLAVAAFLKKQLRASSHLETVVHSLVTCCPHVPAAMQSRIVFLAAWLFAGKSAALSVSQLDQALAAAPSRDQLSAKHCLEAILSSMQRDSPSGHTAGDVVAEAVERFAQHLVAQDIQQSLTGLGGGQLGRFDPKRGLAVVTTAPVRIDLAGGWSDTPPICYELSGSVTNVAITVDGRKPVRCVCAMIDDCVLEMHCRSLTSPGVYVTESYTARSYAGFLDLSCDGATQECLLLRAVFVALGVVDPASHSVDLQAALKEQLGGGVRVCCVSDLPPGSGMGGSSILAAALVRSLSDLLGLLCSEDDLVYQVARVEQILTAGGGWQDQVGAIYGGFKLGHSPARLPLTVEVQTVGPSSAFLHAFERRTFLVYTGQQRLARNTLINALRKNALSPPPVPEKFQGEKDGVRCEAAVTVLISGAQEAWSILQRSTSADTAEEADLALDQLAEVLSRYWELKVEMAAGSEPPPIRALLERLRPLSAGLSLCGAGAGGFAAIVLKRDVPEEALVDLVNAVNSDRNAADRLPLHKVAVDQDGVRSTCNDCTEIMHLSEASLWYYIQ